MSKISISTDQTKTISKIKINPGVCHNTKAYFYAKLLMEKETLN